MSFIHFSPLYLDNAYTVVIVLFIFCILETLDYVEFFVIFLSTIWFNCLIKYKSKLFDYHHNASISSCLHYYWQNKKEILSTNNFFSNFVVEFNTAPRAILSNKTEKDKKV